MASTREVEGALTATVLARLGADPEADSERSTALVARPDDQEE